MQNVLAPRLPSKSKVGTLLICRASKLSCSVPTAMRARGSLRGRLWRAGARHSAPLKSASFRSFLADTRKELNHRTDLMNHSKYFCFPKDFHNTCGMWKNKLWKDFEKSAEKFSYTACVEKFWISTFRLWRKKRCGSKENATFPHKFPLLLTTAT